MPHNKFQYKFNQQVHEKNLDTTQIMSKYKKSSQNRKSTSERLGEYTRNSAADLSVGDGASQPSYQPINRTQFSLPMTRPVPLQYNPALYKTWCANNRSRMPGRPHTEKVHPENGGNASENENNEQENCESQHEYR